MTESDHSEENLDEFMLKASNILSEENNPEKKLIINSLKEHLNSIYQEKSEMENFFKTLNNVIFSNSTTTPNKISNSKPFKLYPILFSFNPKNAYYYVDYFLTSLQMSVSCEENNDELPILISVFAEVIKSFFCEDSNDLLIKKNYLLEKNKKNKLYEKFFNFCNNNIKSENKIEQSFGCLLLTEFVEKCPLIKDQKNFENIFKLITDNLEDHWFECKLDMLNCTISLIFVTKKNFKNYANVCLFKILDFLTDEDWMKKKLAINIVYALAFYCKEEIMKVKDNVIDFLSALKDDPVDEVKQICIKTLNFLEEDGADINNSKNKNKNKKKEDKNLEENLDDYNDDNKEEVFNDINGDEERKDNDANDIKDVDLVKEDKEVIKEIDNKNKENKNNDTLDIEINIKNKEMNEKYGASVELILNQIKKIQETQNILNNMLENVKEAIDNNYTNLNERLKILEYKVDKRNINRKNS